ncbi:hypothetical protein CLOM_g9524 [Closterium sp. NIES-68]|nr:hypothetical protein CLOM_g9524 [Closterium sp. NIES-68]
MSGDTSIVYGNSEQAFRNGSESEIEKEHMTTKGRCKSRSPVRRKSRMLSSLTREDIVKIPSEELTRCFEEDPNLELGANLCKVRQKVYKERHQSKISGAADCAHSESLEASGNMQARSI